MKGNSLFGDIPCSRQRSVNLYKLVGPLLQLIQHRNLATVKHRRHCKDVFLQTVDERDRVLQVHDFLRRNHDQPIKSRMYHSDCELKIKECTRYMGIFVCMYVIYIISGIQNNYTSNKASRSLIRF